MSEYQYHEFLAIDRPLSPSNISELRKLSTRAEITTTSFTNTYNWGDFHGSPSELMEKYFDAHVYVTNWGSYNFMLRIPEGLIDEDLLSTYCIDEPLSFWLADGNLIISWYADLEPDDIWVDGEGWMARLIPIRAEIEKRDYRSLYIGWLLTVSNGFFDEEAIEPEVPPGLGSLTPAQQSLVEFLQINPDLITASAEASAPFSTKSDETEKMSEWIEKLQADEVRRMLLKILNGEYQQVYSELRKGYNQFLQQSKINNKQGSGKPRRTFKQILELAEKAKLKRLKQEEIEMQKKIAREERKRKEYLAGLFEQFPQIWDKVDKLAGEKTASSYDKATQCLVDLHDAYKQDNRDEEFKALFGKFISKHRNRPALIRRLEETKIEIPI